MGVNHRRQEHEVVAPVAQLVGQANQARQRARRWNDRHTGIAAEGVDAVELNDKVQALVHQQREGVRRVQSDRADDRRNLLAEEATNPQGLLVRPLMATQKADALLAQLGQQNVVENAVLAADLIVRGLADFAQHLLRLQPVGPGLFTRKGDLLFQAGHANLKELVEVAGEDQQKLQALKQRVGLIQRLLQYADVELQLRQLTVNVELRRTQIRNRCRFGDLFADLRWSGNQIGTRAGLGGRRCAVLGGVAGAVELCHDLLDTTTDGCVTVAQRSWQNRSGCRRLLRV